ncbi:MAG: hypothetical protein ACHQLA_08490 [Ignavibacteriales bacterium]
MTKYSIAFFILISSASIAQTERYTKDAENGYAWIEMEKEQIMFSTSKDTYLSSILQRFNLLQEKYPELESLSCGEEINQLMETGKSDEISLEDVVLSIDEFYTHRENLIIPIIFAYCYTIKKMAGADKKELKSYKNEVLLFCAK